MYVIDNQVNSKSACVLWYIGTLSISLSISELYSAATPGPRTGVGGEESRLRIELPAAAVAGSAVKQPARPLLRAGATLQSPTGITSQSPTGATSQSPTGVASQSPIPV